MRSVQKAVQHDKVTNMDKDVRQNVPNLIYTKKSPTRLIINQLVGQSIQQVLSDTMADKVTAP